MKHYESIRDYYKAYGHSPPLIEFFDVRTFEQYYEEDLSGTKIFTMEPFRVEFYGIGLLMDGTADKHLGKLFDANLVLYSPYQLLSFEGVQRNWKGYYLLFDQDFLSQCSFGPTFLTDFPFLRLDHVHPLKLNDTHVAELLPIFKKIHEEFSSQGKDKFKLIEIYLNLLLHQLKRATEKVSFTDTDFRNKAEINLIGQYSSLIEEHLSGMDMKHDYFSPSYYAEKIAIHPNHLNAVCKRVTGKTAKQLIQDALIVRAKSLLIQSGRSVKEIAYQLGFEAPSHFSNLFKKLTSLTPAQFREKRNL